MIDKIKWYVIPPYSKWYVIPPYTSGAWKIFDANGELVASFEERTHCEYVVALHNKLIKEMEAHNE